jgi:hypothetical protein
VGRGGLGGGTAVQLADGRPRHVQPGGPPQQAEQDEVDDLVDRVERGRDQAAGQDEQRRP